jgi:dTDP-4-amino-4,6-dideoxygalactose transaminase
MAHHGMHPVFAARASTILYHLVMSVPVAQGVYLLPSNVCPVVPLTLIAAQRPFEFIDLDPASLCMSHALLQQRLTCKALPRVAGIVFVRTYGAVFDITSEFQALKTLQPELLLVDDRCLSRPLLEREEGDWQGADVLLFSTGHAKPVDVGFGGFAHLQPHVPWMWHHRPFIAADEHAITALYKEHIHKQQPLYGTTGAAVPPQHLQTFHWLDTSEPTVSWATYRELVLKARTEAESHATEIIQVYRQDLPDAVQLPSSYHSWRFQIRVPNRETLLKKIFAAGFFASDHYFPAATLFGGYLCPVATALSTDILNLFHDFRVSSADAEQMGKIVQAHLADKREE